MSLVFAVEKVRNVIDELMPLWVAHWKETEAHRVGEVFNVNVESYMKYSDVDYYILYTARDAGRLVGNFGAYIFTSMHTQRREATEDTLFLLPEYRKGLNSVRFVRFVENDLISRGVKKATISVKSTRVGKFCEFLGYNLEAYQYSRELEDKPNVLFQTARSA